VRPPHRPARSRSSVNTAKPWQGTRCVTRMQLLLRRLGAAAHLHTHIVGRLRVPRRPRSAHRHTHYGRPFVLLTPSRGPRHPEIRHMTTTTPATTPADPELIPLLDYLRRISLSKSSFYRLASRGEAFDVVKLGRAVYVPTAAARAWLIARVVPAATLSQTARAPARPLASVA
jgi:hypothetical protein